MGQTGINSRGAESRSWRPAQVEGIVGWQGRLSSAIPWSTALLEEPEAMEPIMIKKILFVTVLSLSSSLALYGATIFPAEASQSSGAGAGK